MLGEVTVKMDRVSRITAEPISESMDEDVSLNASTLVERVLTEPKDTADP